MCEYFVNGDSIEEPVGLVVHLALVLAIVEFPRVWRH